MEISQILQHKWFVKGPWYNGDQLRLYLTQRVKHVLQGRARKIRKLMMEAANMPNHPDYVTRDPEEKRKEMEKRMEEIDPDHLFSANCQSLKDESEMPSSLFQFMTSRSPSEIAVRLDMACSLLGATIKINAEDNAVP